MTDLVKEEIAQIIFLNCMMEQRLFQIVNFTYVRMRITNIINRKQINYIFDSWLKNTQI
jgi:hypothetical protein